MKDKKAFLLTSRHCCPPSPLSAFLDLFISLVDDWGPLGYLAYIVVRGAGAR